MKTGVGPEDRPGLNLLGWSNGSRVRLLEASGPFHRPMPASPLRMDGDVHRVKMDGPDSATSALYNSRVCMITMLSPRKKARKQ